MLRADDALKYAAAILKSRSDWALDSIGGSMCDGDHDVETDALAGIVRDIRELAAQFGDPKRYADGRQIESCAEIQRGFTTCHIWHPDPASEVARSWRGDLPSGHPDVPSPGLYEVSTDPARQELHVRVVRLAGGAA